MISATASAKAFEEAGRLDAHYFLSAGFQAAQGLRAAKGTGLETATMGEIAEVWAPPRFRRIYAVEGEANEPYLRPYDIFKYLPKAADRLSSHRSDNLDELRIRPGMLLQTMSGRNLGPGMLTDRYLAQFVLSHDLARIHILNERLRLYVAAFLQSRVGQELLRRDKTGSVIDHLTIDHIRRQDIPLLDDQTVDAVADLMGQAFRLIEAARLTIAGLISGAEEALPTLPSATRRASGWTTRARDFGHRLDAASHDPQSVSAQRALSGSGGVPLRSICQVRKPAGRYRTRYVEEEYGRPMLSGGQVLQLEPINLRWMSADALREPDRYELLPGWTVFQADGRAEEGLGVPAMVTADRIGWFASGHVGRLVPNEAVHPGALYLAVATRHAQVQLQALAAGSVVDALYTDDLGSLVVPSVDRSLGERALAAWGDFTTARALQRLAVGLLEVRYEELAGTFGDGGKANAPDTLAGAFTALVEAFAEPAQIGDWLTSSVPVLDDRKPIELLARGDDRAFIGLIAELRGAGAV